MKPQFELSQGCVTARKLDETDAPLKMELAISQGLPFRLAILISHPVQYFAPLFRRLAQRPEIDLTVLYCSLSGARKMNDPGFGMSFAWDIPLLEGYRYKVLKNYSRGQLKGFFNYINPGIVRELQKGNYDAVIILGWASFTTWLAFGEARLAGVYRILYGDSIPIYEGGGRWPRRESRRWLLRALFGTTDAFLTSGTFNRKFYDLYGVPAEKCFEAPFAVDVNFFERRSEEARPRRNEIRAKFRIPADKILFLFVGKLVWRKRPHDMLAALKSLRATTSVAAVAFVGEGELRPSLEAQIAEAGLEDAYLLGFRNQSELPDLYAMADAFVLPSSCDPKPLVTNEAMACGLPVIVSDRTGVWGSGDIVRDGENGFVYPCGDVEVLAAAIRKLVVDPGLRQRMGVRSREIIQNFGYEKWISGILQALNSLIRLQQRDFEPGMTSEGYTTRVV